MVNVELYYDGEFAKGFKVSGHAGADVKGKDLVCAGVSALSQTALLGLDAFLTIKPRWEISEDGYLECWLPDGLSLEDFKNARVIIGTLEIGLKYIEDNYGQYLKVSKRRWTKCCSK